MVLCGGCVEWDRARSRGDWPGVAVDSGELDVSDHQGLVPYDLEAPVSPLIPHVSVLRTWLDRRNRQVAHPVKGAWWLGIAPPAPEPTPDKPTGTTEEEAILCQAMSTVDIGYPEDYYHTQRPVEELAPEFIASLAALGWRLARTDMYAFMDDGPRRVWYRAFTPDGELWCESGSRESFQPVALDGMEGEELEYYARRNETLATCRFEKISVYEVSKVEEWKPW